MIAAQLQTSLIDLLDQIKFDEMRVPVHSRVPTHESYPFIRIFGVSDTRLDGRCVVNQAMAMIEVVSNIDSPLQSQEIAETVDLEIQSNLHYYFEETLLAELEYSETEEEFNGLANLSVTNMRYSFKY